MDAIDSSARHAKILAALRDARHPIPSPDAVALNLMRAVERRDVGVFEVCRIARADPVLVAKAVQMANSALFTGLRPTAAMEEAVMRIGVSALARLAVGLSLVHAAEAAPAARGFDLGHFWRRSLAQAMVLQHLVQRMRLLAASEAFTLGLLADIGRLGMVAAFGPEAENTPEGSAELLEEYQRRRWGFDHNEASAALLESWSFPQGLWRTVLPWLGSAAAASDARGRDLALMVDIARGLAAALDDGAATLERVPRLWLSAARLGLDAQAVLGLFEQVREDFGSMARILEIPLSERQVETEFQRLRAVLAAAPPGDEIGPGAVVLVSDDASMGAELEEELRGAGFGAMAAVDTQQGETMVRALHPDALVLDADISGMDALALCRSLRDELGPRLYILVVGGEVGGPRMLQALDAGANDALPKPVDARLLLAKLRLGTRTVRLIASLEQERESASGRQRELSHLNARLREAAYSDGLTGLPNRRALDEFLARAWDEAIHSARPLSCVLLDLDHFKHINDSYGHDVGDRVLRGVAQALQAQSRAGDLLARWGGEELVMVCPGTPAEAALALAERMRAAVERLRGDFPAVTVSAGVAQAGPDGPDSAADMMRAADLALLQAKRQGRNRVVLAGGGRAPAVVPGMPQPAY